VPTVEKMDPAPVGSCNDTPKGCTGSSRTDNAEVAENMAGGGKKAGGIGPGGMDEAPCGKGNTEGEGSSEWTADDALDGCVEGSREAIDEHGDVKGLGVTTVGKAVIGCSPPHPHAPAGEKAPKHAALDHAKLATFCGNEELNAPGGAPSWPSPRGSCAYGSSTAAGDALGGSCARKESAAVAVEVARVGACGGVCGDICRVCCWLEL